VEEHFYFFWPFMVFSLSRRVLMWVCVSGTLLSLVVRLAVLQTHWGIGGCYAFTPCRLDGLLLGSWLALALPDDGGRIRVRKYYRGVGVAALIGLIAIAIWQGHFSNLAPAQFAGKTLAQHSSALGLTLGLVLLAVLFTCVVAAAISGGALARVLETKLLAWIGKRSYGMYVYQPLIVDVVGWRLSQLSWLAVVPRFVAETVVAMAVMVVSIGVATLSFWFFESPFLNLRRKFSRDDSFATAAVMAPAERGAAIAKTS
jgi:peptidoglycan/LPS O-acetylase OafA/YrhL